MMYRSSPMYIVVGCVTALAWLATIVSLWRWWNGLPYHSSTAQAEPWLFRIVWCIPFGLQSPTSI